MEMSHVPRRMITLGPAILLAAVLSSQAPATTSCADACHAVGFHTEASGIGAALGEAFG
jgi:hypothetical protein